MLRSVRVAERLALPTSDHGVAGSNPAGGEILPEPKRRFIEQSLSCSPFHCLEMTEILLKGCKTLTHPSFMLPWQPIKFRDLDKIHMNRSGLLKKHFCKKNLNICSETAKIANFHFSHYKSMETISCHSNQSSYPIGTKNTIIRSPYL